MNWPVNPLRGKANQTTDWRAVCGKSACTVRRGEGPKPIGPSYPYPSSPSISRACCGPPTMKRFRERSSTASAVRASWAAACFPWLGHDTELVFNLFPRRTGVDLAAAMAMTTRPSFPPAYGGGPSASMASARIAGFSPGVRGWTECVAGGRRAQALFPRRTGVDLAAAMAMTTRPSFPPAYGGGPFYAGAFGTMLLFSPGVRGWTEHSAHLPSWIDLFPRRTGVDRSSRLPCEASRPFPPVCGGGPASVKSGPPRYGFSPGVRGWTEPVVRFFPLNIYARCGEVFAVLAQVNGQPAVRC